MSVPSAQPLEPMFWSLGHLTSHSPRLFLSIAILVAMLSALYGADVMRRLSLAPGWEVPSSGSALAREQLHTRLGRDETPVILLFRPRPGGPTHVDQPGYRQAVEAVLEKVGVSPGVLGVESYFSSADARMRSAAGDMTYALVRMERGTDEGIGAYKQLNQLLVSEQLVIEAGGELATYMDARRQLEHDVRRAEILSFALLAVLLIWVFGSPLAAALPLVIGVLTVAMSAAMLKLSTLFTDVTIYAANVVSMLGLGLAIDYSLFIVSRFREELGRGLSLPESLAITMATAGRTVAFSGLTVAASLFCLLIFPQRFFQNMGLAGGISVAAAMLSAILVLPPLLAVLGHRLDRFALPVLDNRKAQQRHGGRWHGFSYFVMRHARLVLLGSLLLLGVMGSPILHMQIGPADSKALPVGIESRRVQETLETAFPGAELSPLLLTLRTRGEAHSEVGVNAAHALTGAIRALPGVTRLQGLTSLEESLTLADYRMLYANPGQFPLAEGAMGQFAKGEYSMILVHYQADPASPEARDLVTRIRALPLPEGVLELQVGGFPAEYLDYVDSLFEWMPTVIAAIVVIIGILLFLMLGSFLLPLKAVLTNLISLSATLGGLVWVFQDGHLASVLGFTPQGKLEGTVLVLIFASAFGLSIDYEVFLLSRIKEMRAKVGSDIKAIAAGIQKSGPIITSAALLIGVVLGTFSMGEVVFMKAMGLGLLFSVIIDATLVRMLLVPASLRLLGRWNWWAPAPLKWLYERCNLTEHNHHKQ